MELYFARQGVRRIGRGLAGTAVPLAIAIFVPALAASRVAILNTIFALAAAGVVCTAAITQWGFARIRSEEQ